MLDVQLPNLVRIILGGTFGALSLTGLWVHESVVGQDWQDRQCRRENPEQCNQSLSHSMCYMDVLTKYGYASIRKCPDATYIPKVHETLSAYNLK